jgi:heme-degrading monooxygenase HmoA
MYSTRLQVMVNPGRAADFEEWARRLFDNQQRQQGFERGSVLNSLGYPAKFTILGSWVNRDAARNWGRNNLRDFLTQNPTEGIATPMGPVDAWETIIVTRSADPTPGAYAVLVDATIDPSKARDFEESRKRLFALRQQYGKGFISNTLSRFLGAPGRYGILVASRSEQDSIATQNAVEVKRYWDEHPISEFGGGQPAIEICEIVYAVVPAGVA